MSIFEHQKVSSVGGPITQEQFDDVIARINATAVLPEDCRGAEIILFTDDELAEARRLLLPHRMKHHDTPFEERLRAACERSERRRRKAKGMR